MLFSRRAVAFCLALWAVLAVFPAMAAAGHGRVQVTDAAGNAVSVKLPVRRLVVLTSDALEMVRALGCAHRVVGVFSGIGRDADFWPELARLPRVGSWKSVNHELAAALAPDLLLCYGRRPGAETEQKLAPFGIQVLRLDFFRPETLVREVHDLARVLEAEPKGDALAAWYKKTFDRIGQGLAPRPDRPRVYLEGDSRYHTAGPGSGGDEICTRAGGRNIAANLSIPYPEVTPEWILAQNPAAIVKITTAMAGGSGYAMAGTGRLERIRTEIMVRPAWGALAAVRQQRVFVLANEIWTGPRAVIGTAHLAKWLHPKIFHDLDPRALHRQYLTGFQNIPFQGTYACP